MNTITTNEIEQLNEKMMQCANHGDWENLALNVQLHDEKLRIYFSQLNENEKNETVKQFIEAQLESNQNIIRLINQEKSQLHNKINTINKGKVASSAYQTVDNHYES